MKHNRDAAVNWLASTVRVLLHRMEQLEEKVKGTDNEPTKDKGKLIKILLFDELFKDADDVEDEERHRDDEDDDVSFHSFDENFFEQNKFGVKKFEQEKLGAENFEAEIFEKSKIGTDAEVPVGDETDAPMEAEKEMLVEVGPKVTDGTEAEAEDVEAFVEKIVEAEKRTSEAGGEAEKRGDDEDEDEDNEDDDFYNEMMNDECDFLMAEAAEEERRAKCEVEANIKEAKDKEDDEVEMANFFREAEKKATNRKNKWATNDVCMIRITLLRAIPTLK